MARKKTITREQILAAAYEVAATRWIYTIYCEKHREQNELFHATDLS